MQDFFGLLGPHGAGKTIMIGIITSLVKKSGGHIHVFRHSMDQELRFGKTFIGLVPQAFHFSLFDWAIDMVVNQADYYGIGRRTAPSSTEFYLKA